MTSQKTINVVYNVDTKSVQVATQQVTAAKQATDQLNQSAQNLGNNSAASMKNWQSSIGEVKVQMEQMKALIDLTNRSDTALLDQRIAKYNELKKQVDDFNSKLDKTGQTANSVAANFNSLYNTVRLVVTAGIIKETITAQLEMAKLAGKVEGVKLAFNSLPNATLLLEDLRRSTHGTVDDLTLMQQTLRAQNYKIPLQNLGTLLEFAAVKAQQTGQEVNHLVDYIVSGIGLRSIRRLDDLGFTASRVKEALGGVTVQSASMGQVMNAVVKLMNEDLARTGGYAKTSEMAVKQLEVAWHDLKVTISELVGSPEVANFFKTIVQGAREFFRTDEQRNQSEAQRAAIAMSQDVIKLHGQNKEAIDKEIESLKKLVTSNNATIESNKEYLKSSHGAGGFETSKKLGEENYQLQQRNIILQEGIKVLGEYSKKLEMDKKLQEEATPKGYLENLNEQIEKLQEQIPKQRSVVATQQIMEEIRQLENLKNLWMSLVNFQNQGLTGLEGSKEAQNIRQKVFDNAKKGVESFNKWLIQRDKADTKLFLGQIREENKEKEEEEKAHQARMKKLMSFAGQQLFYNARLIATELTQVEVQRLDDQISATREYYDNQITLAGDNTKAQERLKKQEDTKLKKLEKERADAQKKANIRKVEIDTAANVIRSILENGGIPYGLPFGAIAFTMGLAQIAAINGFAEGVIDLKGGQKGKDSIPSMLMPGESVMTTKETQDSMNILKSIRAKKLNDKVLEKLMIQVPQLNVMGNNKDVVEALDRNKPRQVDLVRQGSVIYEAKESSKNMRRLVRSKSFNP